MKRIIILNILGALLFTSCNKYLDVNKNLNSATSATPQVLLPQAITATAGVLNTFNNYGAVAGGFMANAGGYGGFGSVVTYSYSSGDNNGLWSGTYHNMEDYQQIITQADADPNFRLFNGASRILRAMDFQLLVDEYNDIPYLPVALQGNNNLTPPYTKAQDVYANLGVQLDSAILLINSGLNDLASNSSSNVINLGSSDPLFAGNMKLWIQLANTLKLRLIVHANGSVNFSNTNFDPAGFLTSDALINPGFTRDNGKQNPQWNQWVYQYTGTVGGSAPVYMPTKWIISWYNANKLNDPRGAITFYNFPNTGANQLGVQSSSVPNANSAGGNWFAHANSDAVTAAASAGNSIGVMKGPNAGFPLMLAAESYFLQAEAAVRGLPGGTGNAATLFNNGIQASFKYLYLLPDDKSNSADPNWNDPVGDMGYYLSTNASSYLVNYSLAATQAQQIEAIITQKYLALNMIASHEAWNEYRRTLYPTIVNGSSNAVLSFASVQSLSTRPDKLPTRNMYPNSEYYYNPSNVPKNISPFTSLIFWAHQ